MKIDQEMKSCTIPWLAGRGPQHHNMGALLVEAAPFPIFIMFINSFPHKGPSMADCNPF